MDCPWALLPHNSGFRSALEAPGRLSLGSSSVFAALSLVANSTGLQLSSEPSSAASSCQALENCLCFCSPSEPSPLPSLSCSCSWSCWVWALLGAPSPEPNTGMCQEHHPQLWGSLKEGRAPCPGSQELLCTWEIIFCSGIDLPTG